VAVRDMRHRDRESYGFGGGRRGVLEVAAWAVGKATSHLLGGSEPLPAPGLGLSPSPSKPAVCSSFFCSGREGRLFRQGLSAVQ